MREMLPSGSARVRRDEHTEALLEKLANAPDEHRAAALRDEVVIENCSMAVGLARHFGRSGVDPEDLVQVAMVGLVQAVHRYRPDAGPGFSAYAVPTITGELKRYFRDHSWSVRPPRGLQELHRSVRDCREELEQHLQRDPTDDEIAEHLKVALELVEQARVVERQFRAVSLDAPARRGSDSPLSESVPASDEDPCETTLALVSLRGAMANLTPREQQILRMRFERGLTQRQIGTRLGISQMQVSRLLREIKTKLRNWMEDPPQHQQQHARTA